MLLVQIVNYEIETQWLVFILTVVGLLAWWLITMYFTVKSLKKEILLNRENSKGLADSFAKEVVRLTGLIDAHSKEDDRKFGHILTSLGEISGKLGIAIDRIALIVDGKLGK